MCLCMTTLTPHTAVRTNEFLAKFKWDVFDYPLHSWDLAPSDCHLFPNMKQWLASQWFNNDRASKHRDRLATFTGGTFLRRRYFNDCSKIWQVLESVWWLYRKIEKNCSFQMYNTIFVSSPAYFLFQNWSYFLENPVLWAKNLEKCFFFQSSVMRNLKKKREFPGFKKKTGKNGFFSSLLLWRT